MKITDSWIRNTYYVARAKSTRWCSENMQKAAKGMATQQELEMFNRMTSNVVPITQMIDVRSKYNKLNPADPKELAQLFFAEYLEIERNMECRIYAEKDNADFSIDAICMFAVLQFNEMTERLLMSGEELITAILKLKDSYVSGIKWSNTILEPNAMYLNHIPSGAKPLFDKSMLLKDFQHWAMTGVLTHIFIGDAYGKAAEKWKITPGLYAMMHGKSHIFDRNGNLIQDL